MVPEPLGIDCVYGLSGDVVLDRLVEAARNRSGCAVPRARPPFCAGLAETRYTAKSWDGGDEVVARIEANAGHADDVLRRGMDVRYVVALAAGQ